MTVEELIAHLTELSESGIGDYAVASIRRAGGFAEITTSDITQSDHNKVIYIEY